MKASLIGIDAAAQFPNFGIALGTVENGTLTVTQCVTRRSDALGIVVDWCLEAMPDVISIDAPLGWPRELGRLLETHRAGNHVPEESNRLFHRKTDDFVWETLRKKPLEVGADKIARAAVTALKFVAALRSRVGQRLPLLSRPGIGCEAGIIEVYPAATLRAYGIPDRGYKGNKAEHRTARSDLLASLRQLLNFQADVDLMLESDDALDAVICLLAAFDFVHSRVHCPADEELAAREGWIWFADQARLPNIVDAQPPTRSF